MFGNRSIGVVALGVLTLASAMAVAGWAAHGEAIFLRLAETAWTTCF